MKTYNSVTKAYMTKIRIPWYFNYMKVIFNYIIRDERRNNSSIIIRWWKDAIVWWMLEVHSILIKMDCKAKVSWDLDFG